MSKSVWYGVTGFCDNCRQAPDRHYPAENDYGYITYPCPVQPKPTKIPDNRTNDLRYTE